MWWLDRLNLFRSKIQLVVLDILATGEARDAVDT